MLADVAGIAELREVLPWWVNAFAWVGLPAVGLGLGIFATWWADKINRPDLQGLHWTEQARLHAEGSNVVNRQAFLHGVLTGVVAFLSSGLLTGSAPILRAFSAALVVWAAVLVIQYRRGKRALPNLTPGEFMRGQVFWWVVFAPILLVVIVMAVFGPIEWGWSFGIIHFGGIVAMAWIVRGGAVTLGRACGLITPANERLSRIVADAADRSDHAPAKVWIGRTPMANAMAFPATNELLFTDVALRELTDDELRAITLHEIGHLKESTRDVFKRLMAIGVFVVAGMWRPITTHLGLVWFLALLGISIAVVMISRRTTRRLEDEADDHVHEHEHEDESGTYARSLERLHEINLSPAVARGKHATHPHLYDRMIAAGVTPDYPRPEPPSAKKKQIVGFAVLALFCYAVQVTPFVYFPNHSYDSRDHALWAIAVTGGQAHTIGAFGAKLEESHPAQAVVALTVADNHSNGADFAARLARVLAKTDPDAAYLALARAEQVLGERKPEEIGEWLRDIIDEARDRLGLPKREW